MSATLQRDWLEKSPETQAFSGDLPETKIPPKARKGPLWDDVQKPVRLERIKDEKDGKALAKLVLRAHLDAGSERQGPTLVVVNTVDLAVKVHNALNQEKQVVNVDLRLVHSRFRPHERAGWRGEFLNREACAPGIDRIIVSTQVIEAGVDLSASVLVTELAPWPSLVQRFGRAARWGGRAQVIVVDREPKDDKAAAPYTQGELDAARDALEFLEDVAPLALERFEEEHAESLPALYPYAPKHLLLPHELDELFDTTPDLTGADIDVSRFIRSGDERDLQVFWLDIEKGSEPGRRLRPAREALCSVPFLRARDWLCGAESKTAKAPRLKVGMRAWVWDWLGGSWRVAERKDLYPGQTVLVAAACGGYDETVGWDPAVKQPVLVVAPAKPSQEEQSDAAQDDEQLSAMSEWQTIAVHGQQVGAGAAALSRVLVPNAERLFDLAGRWHDAGKVHRVFQGSMKDSAERPSLREIAKAPDDAWLSPKNLYPDGNGRRRAGFRHELASTARLFSVLINHMPDHPALLGPWHEMLDAMGTLHDSREQTGAPNALEREIVALSAEEFDLLAYLICAHHGKVRFAWHASPADQEAADDVLRIRGVRDGELLPSVLLASSEGEFVPLAETALTLAPSGIGLSPVTGRGWTDRVLGLLKRHSPFQLAYLEALLRAADIRASRSPVADPLLSGHAVAHGLEGSDSALASPPGRGATGHLDPRDSALGRAQHGVRGGAGGPGSAGARAPEVSGSTRYVDTKLGLLRYTELAPHLAAAVQALQLSVAEGSFRERPLDEALLLELHRGICGELIPRIAGRWRTIDVRVGEHTAPRFPEVPILMRDYTRDLQARLAGLPEGPSEELLECLAFAEGRLLYIHPFEDFNGRVTRVLLSELLQRLALPAVDLAPDTEDERAAYLAALRAADKQDWGPLISVWQARLGTEGGP